MRNGGKKAVESGKTFERAIVNLLKKYGFKDARRTHQDRQGHSKALMAPDIEGTPYWIECSRSKGLKWTGGLALAERKFEQAERDCVNAQDKRDVLVFISCGKTGSDRFLFMRRNTLDSAHSHCGACPTILLSGFREAWEMSWPSFREVMEALAKGNADGGKG